jgi:hypothetical protein
MRDILLISRAWNFAAQRHSTQRRKGNLVAAVVLHDTVQDTAALPAELASMLISRTW